MSCPEPRDESAEMAALRRALDSIRMLASQRLTARRFPPANKDAVAWGHVMRICKEHGSVPRIIRVEPR